MVRPFVVVAQLNESHAFVAALDDFGEERVHRPVLVIGDEMQPRVDQRVPERHRREPLPVQINSGEALLWRQKHAVYSPCPQKFAHAGSTHARGREPEAFQQVAALGGALERTLKVIAVAGRIFPMTLGLVGGQPGEHRLLLDRALRVPVRTEGG